jgi:hypothetical protein
MARGRIVVAEGAIERRRVRETERDKRGEWGDPGGFLCHVLLLFLAEQPVTPHDSGPTPNLVVTSSLSTEYLANLEMAALPERLRDLEGKLARAKEGKSRFLLTLSHIICIG